METFKKTELYSKGNKLFGIKYHVITGQGNEQHQVQIHLGYIFKVMFTHCFGSSAGIRLSIWKLSVHLIIGIN